MSNLVSTEALGAALVSTETAPACVEHKPKAMHDYVLVQFEQDRVTKSGLILPESKGQEYLRVISAGPKCTTVKEGDRVAPGVAMNGQSASWFPWGTEEIYCLKEEYIAALLPDDDGFLASYEKPALLNE